MEDCNHPNTETRKMSHCNQIKLQCLDCGAAVGNPIRHAAIEAHVLAEIEEFDYEFRDLMRERQAEIFRQEQESRRMEWESGRLHRYAAYLKTPEWRERRAKVIDRENGLCQGCREKRITEIHHLTYDNRGDELLFQLVGLCSDCHAKLHPNEH